MEDNQEYPQGRRRLLWGKKYWLYPLFVALAVAIAFVLVLVMPGSNPEINQASDAIEEITPEEAATQPPAAPGVPQTPHETGGQDQSTAPTVSSGSTSDLVVHFPAPQNTDPGPPEGGYRDIYGQWVLEMTGAQYGLDNCYVRLEKEGNITAPAEYNSVFEIMGSQYTWDSGGPEFSATLQLAVKMGSSQVLIPLEVVLTGRVDGSFAEINGDFKATPQGELYAPYAQSGRFRMYR